MWGSNEVWLRKTWSQQPEKLRDTNREEVERSQALNASVLTVCSFQFQLPFQLPFTNCLAKIDKNFYLQFNSMLFQEYRGLCSFSPMVERGCGDCKYKGPTRVTKHEDSATPHISSQTFITCWVRCTGCCIKP